MKAKFILSTVSNCVAGLSFAAVSLSTHAICQTGADCVSVPEPSILGLMGVGVAALVLAPLLGRKRK
jgi:hypothetical protein